MIYASSLLFGQYDTLSVKSDCKTTITKIFIWYKQFDAHKNDYKITRSENVGGKNYLRVDTVGCRKYLNQFKKTGYFTTTYLQRKWSELTKADSILFVSKETEYPININLTEILSSDPLLFQQDYFEYLNQLNELKYGGFQIINNNQFTLEVIIKDIRLLYTLSKVSNQYQVENIENITHQ